jgi:transcriptional regulator with XRE-family HTH domain
MSDNQLELEIKNLLKKRNLHIGELCEKIGMSHHGLNKTLKNNTIKLETLQKIADVLEVSITYFFGSGSSGNKESDKRVMELERELEMARQTISNNNLLIEMLKERNKEKV